MNKVINFYKRNLKEVLRDPIIYIFCLGFPIAMFLLFHIINKFSNGNTPIFEVLSLLPGIIVFSYSFVMLTLAIIVSKDKQTFFLKRLYSSPMKSYYFILGYSLVGLFIGLLLLSFFELRFDSFLISFNENCLFLLLVLDFAYEVALYSQ